MAERPKSKWLRPRVVLPALLACLVLTAVLSPVGQDATGRYLSTRSSAINGSSGLRAILDRLGWHTSERITPYSGALDTTATYVMLSTPVAPSAHEVHTLLDAVRRGAKLIVVPEREGPIADSIGVRSSEPSFLPFHPTSDTLLGSPGSGADTLRDALGIPTARVFHQYLEGTPPTDSDSVGTWPSTARVILSVELKRPRPEIAILPLGRGQVVAMGEADFLRNDVLRKTAGAVLAVRVLESIDSTRSSPIVFDEYHQGYGERITTLGVIGSALVGTTWGLALIQLALAGLLYLMVLGVRPIAPVARARYERRSPLEHVGALSRAYEAIGASQLAVQRLVRGVRRRHPLGTTSHLSDEQYLALLRARIPAAGGDIDTLIGTLAKKPTAEQLVLAGSAIDHIERNLKS